MRQCECSRDAYIHSIIVNQCSQAENLPCNIQRDAPGKEKSRPDALSCHLNPIIQENIQGHAMMEVEWDPKAMEAVCAILDWHHQKSDIEEHGGYRMS